MAYNVWSDQELAVAKTMKAAGRSTREIAEAIGRTPGAVRRKFSYEFIYRVNEINYTQRCQPPDVPSTVLEDRLHRLGIEPRDLTAALLGDPPPGYSALERRT